MNPDIGTVLLARPKSPRETYRHLVLNENTSLHLVHRDTAPDVELRVLFPQGSQCDPIGKEGLAHCAEHAVFNQMRANNNHIVESMRRGLIEVNGATQMRGITFEATARISHHADNYFPEFLKHILEPENGSSNFKIDIDVLMAENLLRARNWLDSVPKNPYYEESLHYFHRQTETVESLARITFEDIAQFRRNHFVHGRTEIVLVGNISPRLEYQTIQLAQARPGPLSQSNATDFGFEQEYPQPAVVDLTAKISDCEIGIILPFFRRTEKDFAAATLIASHLATGPENAMSRHLRRELGLTYSNGAFTFENYGPPLININFHSLNYAKAEQAITVLRRNLSSWIDQIKNPGELEIAKEGFGRSIFTYSGAVANSIVNARVAKDDILFPDELLDRTAHVTVDEIAAASARMLHRQKIFIFGKGMPPGMRERLQRLLGDWNT